MLAIFLADFREHRRSLHSITKSAFKIKETLKGEGQISSFFSFQTKSVARTRMDEAQREAMGVINSEYLEREIELFSLEKFLVLVDNPFLFNSFDLIILVQ